MPEQTRAPRLGAALIFGADACRAVHVHTNSDGVAAIENRLRELDAAAYDGNLPTTAVIAVLGSSRSAIADWDEFDVPRDAVDALAAFALGLNVPAVDG